MRAECVSLQVRSSIGYSIAHCYCMSHTHYITFLGKDKIRLSLCLVKYAMKGCREVNLEIQIFFTSGNNQRREISYILPKLTFP
jgi:hypothetical protein